MMTNRYLIIILYCLLTGLALKYGQNLIYVRRLETSITNLQYQIDIQTAAIASLRRSKESSKELNSLISKTLKRRPHDLNPTAGH